MEGKDIFCGKLSNFLRKHMPLVSTRIASRRGYSIKYPQHMNLWRTDGNLDKLKLIMRSNCESFGVVNTEMF